MKYVDKYNKKDKFFIVGYNSTFDVQFLRQFFLLNRDDYFGSWFWAGSIDVMVLAIQRCIEVRRDMVDFKLTTVCKTLGIEVDELKAHDAMYDIELTKKLYEEITRP